MSIKNSLPNKTLRREQRDAKKREQLKQMLAAKVKKLVV